MLNSETYLKMKRFLSIIAIVIVVLVIGRLSYYFYPFTDKGIDNQGYEEGNFVIEGQVKGIVRGTVIEKGENSFVFLPRNKTKPIKVEPSPSTIFWLSPDPEKEKEIWSKLSTRELSIIDILEEADFNSLRVDDEISVYFQVENGKGFPEQVSIFK